jgi:hypothetical protein
MDLIDHARESIADALATPPDFGYFGDLPLGKDWTLGPVIDHRDLDLLGKSNGAAIRAAVEAASPSSTACPDQPGGCGHDWAWECEGWTVTTCGHWAVGWTEHLSYRVIDGEGNPTPQHLAVTECLLALEDYPVLDDEDYSGRCYTACLEAIEQAAPGSLVEGADDWVGQVYAWLSDRGEGRLDCIDAPGGDGPSEDDVKRACAALGLLSPEDED